MKVRRWMAFPAVVAIVLGGLAVFPRAGSAADRSPVVMGIVERVSGTVVSVAGKTYDLKGVPLRSEKGVGTVDLSTLRGKTIEIVFRNRRIEYATVYRTLPQ